MGFVKKVLVDEARIFRAAPLGRGPYLGLGILFFAIKVGVDMVVAGAFNEPYSILYYVSPLDAPLFHPGERLPFWLAFWAVALPFIAIGVWLTLRRLLDARLPGWLVVLFFFPFANLIFFLALAAVPSRPADSAPATGYRKPLSPSRGRGTALLMSAAAGAVVALGMVGASVGIFGLYGASLFLGTPTISAFTATMVFARLHSSQVVGTLAATFLALALIFVSMLAFALEGALCLLMAAPLAAAAALLGWGIALVFAYMLESSAWPTTPATMVLLPLWVIAEVVFPLPAESNRIVESTLEIAAPPEVVWNRVLAFEELPPPTELLFRLGVAAPTGATIEGDGVGALRRCRFTTGEFEEPITAWVPGRELAFDVRRQPDPMRELSPWPDLHPPHLGGYFATTRGQFLLERLPGDRTRLRGRTWYRLDIFPRTYWSWWADSFVHTVHVRVMRQIKCLAERDHKAAG